MPYGMDGDESMSMVKTQGLAWLQRVESKAQRGLRCFPVPWHDAQIGLPL